MREREGEEQSNCIFRLCLEWAIIERRGDLDLIFSVNFVSVDFYFGLNFMAVDHNIVTIVKLKLNIIVFLFSFF